MLYTCLSLLVAAPVVAVAPQTNQMEQTMRNEIHADQLKNWYAQGKEMVVLDARTAPYFDGTLLPNAVWMPADAQDSDIQAAIPSKGALVVVYCAGVGCPASGWLYDKLVSWGYTNVYEYPEGLQDWVQRGYPTTTMQQ